MTHPAPSLVHSAGIPWETYPQLERPGLRHAFSLRSALSREELPAALPEFLSDAGFAPQAHAEPTQPHGNGVARVDEAPPDRIAGADALITNTPGLALVTRMADCGPVFFHDAVTGAIGVAHSGRKGTEANITGATVAALAREFGTRPADLRVLLGPCIRPPHYEVAFAEEILRQARRAGVEDVHDTGACTASDPGKYYSYRMEKGNTGRHWAVVMKTQ